MYISGPHKILVQIVCLPKSVTDSRIESNFKGRPSTLHFVVFLKLNIRIADVELSAEDFDLLEKAAAASPQKRVVVPDWGLDIFEDAKQKAKL